MSLINLKSSERVFITGKTGAGKTFLAKYLTAKISRLVVLDGKGTLRPWGLDDWSLSARSALRSGQDVRVRVQLPVNRKLNAVEFWDDILDCVYRAGNCTLYIDEIYSVAPPTVKPSPMLFSVYTRGRELGIGVWGGSQRPVWMPLVALSEAEHFFMFRLQLEDDRRRMSEFMGDDVLTVVPDKYGFYYYNISDDSPTYYKGLEVAKDEVVISNAAVKPAQSVKKSITRRLLQWN